MTMRFSGAPMMAIRGRPPVGDIFPCCSTNAKYSTMTNVHPFPKSPKGNAVKPKHKDPGLAGCGPAFRLRDHNGDPVDVLMMVIQAGGMYLIPTTDRPDDDLPTTHLLRTLDGLDALTDAANVLIYDAMCYPADCSQEAADALIGKGKQAHKMMRKLYDMLPTDDFIVTMGSYGPDLMAEYATNAAIIVASTFAMDIMAYYYGPFIRTEACGLQGLQPARNILTISRLGTRRDDRHDYQQIDQQSPNHHSAASADRITSS